MGKTTAISWTERSQNFWRGCRRVSEGCRNCYMFRDQIKYGLEPTEIVRTKTWGDPIKWNKEAEKAQKPILVFTCSWSDFFIKEADPWRADAWAIIRTTPWLIYQILTKRHERIQSCLPPDWDIGYPNVWLGVSIENNDYLCRADTLRIVPAQTRFISAEPLLGSLHGLNLEGIHWLICGGESGPGYRNINLDHVRELRDICGSAQVPFFYKQGSGNRPGMHTILDGQEHKNFPLNERISLPLL